jgi:hypothetical protein
MAVCTFVAVCLISACSMHDESGTARLSIAIRGTSDPAASSAGGSTSIADDVVERAVVTVDRIELQPGDEGIEGDSVDRVVLRDRPIVVDFTNLSALTRDLVADAIVPAGRYSQLRFVISGGFIEVASQGIYATAGYPAVPAGALVTGELQMPSYATSGLKVNLPDGGLDLGSGTHRILRVDFDVSQSFGHVAGSSSAWVMHPVIQATDVTASANVVVNLDATPLAPPPALPVRAELRPQSGSLVENLQLMSDGSQHFSGTFAFVDPDQSPFVLSVFSNTAAMTTDPSNPFTFTLESGETRSIELRAIGVAAP